ncbi:SDR family oxidoreductase [Mycobacterium simiae]|uniref:SDR family oxidoreductase n=1 Tax=Mycobacterium simiae TaxID=1784 RepID=A0A5B1BJ31_MYCSI|nr:SDR family oxidoreductase [Mycobacterium simiae]KAA1248376.1 SDR family oxidoreductase [Mycobacterium simiae]
MIQTNLSRQFTFNRDAYPRLNGHARAVRVVITGSMTSLFGAGIGAAYAASKGGAVQFARSLAAAGDRGNILVNAVLPGRVRTPLTETGRRSHPDHPWRIDERIPQARRRKPSEIPGLIRFLRGDLSRYITGSALTVDGGFSGVR